MIHLLLGAHLLIAVDASPKVEAVSMSEKCDLRWDEFQREIDWYVDSLTPKDDIQSIELKQAVIDVQEAFINFREKISQLLYLNSKGSYATLIKASSALDATNWYTNYVEKKLFPYGWKESYITFLKSKKQTDGENPK